MKTKFHVNNDNEAKPCGATVRKCRFGESSHYATLSEAQSAADEKNKKEHGGNLGNTLSRKKTTKANGGFNSTLKVKSLESADDYTDVLVVINQNDDSLSTADLVHISELKGLDDFMTKEILKHKNTNAKVIEALAESDNWYVSELAASSPKATPVVLNKILLKDKIPGQADLASEAAFQNPNLTKENIKMFENKYAHNDFLGVPLGTQKEYAKIITDVKSQSNVAKKLNNYTIRGLMQNPNISVEATEILLDRFENDKDEENKERLIDFIYNEESLKYLYDEKLDHFTPELRKQLHKKIQYLFGHTDD